MKTRLSEVAEFAGVSTATVGRVLNGKAGIAAETRDAVLTALDVFGFERPVRFRAETAGLVGLVMPDLQNPIFPAFAEAVSLRLVKTGLMPVLCTRTADAVSEAHYIKLLLKHNVAGIIFVGASYADAGPEYGRELRERKIPIVLINPADINEGVSTVSVDDEAAVDQAMSHLSALGHDQIGLILGPIGHVPSARKLAAYRAAQERANPGSTAYGVLIGTNAPGGPDSDRESGSWRDLVAHTSFSMEGGAQAATRLLAEGVTAIVCASDALALGAIRAARRRGLSVPGDLSVVGFDDSIYMIATDPALTTLRQPIEAMSAAAVESLNAQINGNRIPTDQSVFEPELIVRSSTGMRRR
jgi:DNA-binding LacI/PurR family transcriptional regulator